MIADYTGIGSRHTPQPMLADMTNIATLLRRRGYYLRSGGARGADTAFEQGAGSKCDIYLPWARFNGHSSKLTYTAEAAKLAAKYHPAWSRCNRIARMMHARNCHVVLGPQLNDASHFIVCWTPDGRVTGGTGQALRIAKAWHVPIFNLAIDGDRDKLLEYVK